MSADEVNKDKDLLPGLALHALKRAAKNARDLAILHNTHLIIWRDNRVVKIPPDKIAELDSK